jgi:hypothetical protein
MDWHAELRHHILVRSNLNSFKLLPFAVANFLQIIVVIVVVIIAVDVAGVPQSYIT